MTIKPLQNDAEYQAALTEIESLMAAKFGTPELARLDALATRVEAYEAQHFPMELPDPVDVIKFYMDQKGLAAEDLVPYIGRLDRVYDILNARRPLTLQMIRRLRDKLGIPADLLMQPSATQEPAALPNG